MVESKENLEIAHVTNFLDAVTKGSALHAGIQTGVDACNPVHLSRAAYWERKRMRFDSNGSKIIADV